MADTRLTREYFCSNCGLATDRDKLTVKKAVFTGMGSKAKTFKSRVVSHLCHRPTCLPADPEWKLPAYNEPEFKVLPDTFHDPRDDQPKPPEGVDPDQLELPLEPEHLLQP